MSRKFSDKHQVWTSWLAVVLSALSFVVSAISLNLSFKMDSSRLENLSVTVEPIWNGYKASISDGPNGLHSVATQWRVVAVNTSDRPLSVISYQISGNKVGYPIVGERLYDEEGKPTILPSDFGPGESMTFSLQVGLWIDRRVFEFSENAFNKSEPPMIEELREKLLQSHGIDFFGNNMTKRGMYLPRGRAILYPEKGFEDPQVEIQFVTARQNTFRGASSWYAYEAIKNQNVGGDRHEIFFRLMDLSRKFSKIEIQSMSRNSAAD